MTWLDISTYVAMNSAGTLVFIFTLPFMFMLCLGLVCAVAEISLEDFSKWLHKNIHLCIAGYILLITLIGIIDFIPTHDKILKVKIAKIKNELVTKENLGKPLHDRLKQNDDLQDVLKYPHVTISNSNQKKSFWQKLKVWVDWIIFSIRLWWAPLHVSFDSGHGEDFMVVVYSKRIDNIVYIVDTITIDERIEVSPECSFNLSVEKRTFWQRFKIRLRGRRK